MDNRAHGKNVTISIMTKRLKNLVINDGLSKKESLAAAYLCLEIYEDSAPNGLVNSVFTEWCQLLHPSKGGHVRDYFMLQVIRAKKIAFRERRVSSFRVFNNYQGVYGDHPEFQRRPRKQL